MAISHKDRTSEGTRAEKLVLRGLRRQGIEADRAEPGKPWDLIANGKKVEVKAAIETTTTGSDGNPITGVVFSNIGKGADVYHLIEMSPDRSRQKGSWSLYPGEIPGVTFTVTRKKRSELPRRDLADMLSKKASFSSSVVQDTLVSAMAYGLSGGDISVAGQVAAIIAVRTARDTKASYDSQINKRYGRPKFRF